MLEKVTKMVIKNPAYKKGVGLLQSVKLGKHKIGLYDAILIFIKKMGSDELLDRTNGVAYSFTVAIFPPEK